MIAWGEKKREHERMAKEAKKEANAPLFAPREEVRRYLGTKILARCMFLGDFATLA